MTSGADPGPEPLRPPFRHAGGWLWRAELPARFAEPSDTEDDPTASRLRLFEDGAELGPGHTLHAEIEREGRGRYSHWRDGLRFSTSDGSDPNTNGRRYAVALGAPVLKVLGFGSCHIYGALADLHARRAAVSLWSDPALVYTPREMLQVVDDHLGRLALPEVLRRFAQTTESPVSSVAPVLRAADVVFLEIGSPIDILYDGFCVPRGQVIKGLVGPVGALGRAEHRVVMRWYHHGLLKQNEAQRRELADLLLEALPRADLDAALAGELVRNLRGSRQDDAAVVETIARIRDRLGAAPVCVMSAQNMFTPDGRPVTWPGNFPKDLDRICREIGLPILHSSRLVAELGPAFALESDLHHFTPQFLSRLGDEMLALARTTLGAA